MYNKQPMLPISLQRKRAKRILARVVPCVLLLLLSVTVIFVFGEVVFPYDERYDGSSLDGVKIMLSIFLLLAPFVITGVPLKLIDSAWSGTVTNIDIITVTGVYTTGGGEPWPYTKNDMVLTIKKDNGKMTKYTVMSLGTRPYSSANDTLATGKMEHHEAKFQVGDRVHKYYGYKHIYATHQDERECKYCISCGTANKLERHNCWSCNADLIKTPSLRRNKNERHK